MSYYRYALELFFENGYYECHRSLTPLPYDSIIENDFFTYRHYTSETEKEDTENCYVVSIGYERRPNDRATQLHYNRYAIHYFVGGKGTYQGQPIKAGQMLIVPPYKQRHFESDFSDPLEFYYVTVAGKGSVTIANNVGIGSEALLTECPFISHIPSLFYELLFVEHSESDPSLFLMGSFLKLMALHKNFSSRAQDVPKERSFFYYKQAIQYIEWYLLSDITPDDIASYLHISPPYLRKIFAKHCNCSLRDYLLQKRLRYAADQLSVTQCTVLTAANAIGYNDCAQFSKMFKKQMGVSPGEYKKLHKPPAQGNSPDKASPLNNAN